MHAPADDNLHPLPPHSIEAEMCLIGAMMLAGDDKALFAECRAGVAAASFFQEDHGVYFRVLCDLADRGSKIDATIVREELIRRKQFADVGGMDYLVRLLGSVPSPAHGPHYGKIVREKSVLRGVLSAASAAARAVYAAADHDRATDIVQETMAQLARLTATATATEYVTLETAAHETYAQLEKGETVLIPTGIEPVDADLGGIGLGEMLVIGARPSMGKSTIARQIAVSAARLKAPVAYISLEESRHKIARNMLSAIADVENGAMRRGRVEPHEWPALANGVATLSTLPVYIADKAFRMPAIRAVASMLVARHGCRIVVVDYLQKIQIDGKDRFEKVTNASNELSALFKELNVAGVVLAQLKREVASRGDKRPGMSDLRESGQIEQDADQILLLHREDYYRSTGESDGAPDGVAELIKAKYRDGARGGTIYLKSNLKYQRFEAMQPPADHDPFRD